MEFWRKTDDWFWRWDITGRFVTQHRWPGEEDVPEKEKLKKKKFLR